jgi:hypothetical protein
MDPDLFITIAFASFVCVTWMAGSIFMAVTLVRSRRQAKDPYERERLPSADAQGRSRAST